MSTPLRYPIEKEPEDMNDGGSVVVAEKTETLPAVHEPEPQSLLPAIITLAKDATVDVAKLDALLKMRAAMEARQAEREAIDAFTALSAELPHVKKTGVIDMGSKGSMKFAKWDEMDKVIRPLLVKHGFTLSFNSVERAGGGLTVTGELMHRSGHVRTAAIPLALDTGAGRNNLQAMGSTLSYGKRYCAEMLLNIVRDDDDDGTKGGMKFVSPEQVEELSGLMAETGTDEGKFCAIFNVAHIAELPDANVVAARNMLLAKKQKRGAAS